MDPRLLVLQDAISRYGTGSWPLIAAIVNQKFSLAAPAADGRPGAVVLKPWSAGDCQRESARLQDIRSRRIDQLQLARADLLMAQRMAETLPAVSNAALRRDIEKFLERFSAGLRFAQTVPVPQETVDALADELQQASASQHDREETFLAATAPFPGETLTNAPVEPPLIAPPTELPPGRLVPLKAMQQQQQQRLLQKSVSFASSGTLDMLAASETPPPPATKRRKLRSSVIDSLSLLPGGAVEHGVDSSPTGKPSGPNFLKSRDVSTTTALRTNEVMYFVWSSVFHFPHASMYREYLRDSEIFDEYESKIAQPMDLPTILLKIPGHEALFRGHVPKYHAKQIEKLLLQVRDGSILGASAASGQPSAERTARKKAIGTASPGPGAASAAAVFRPYQTLLELKHDLMLMLCNSLVYNCHNAEFFRKALKTAAFVRGIFGPELHPSHVAIAAAAAVAAQSPTSLAEDAAPATAERPGTPLTETGGDSLVSENDEAASVAMADNM